MLAPIKVAVLPLVNKDGLPEMSKAIFDKLKLNFACHHDVKDAIGRRYRRQDAIGTPCCVTVDTESLENNTVTIRYRDDMQQKRVAVDQLFEAIDQEVSFKKILEKLNV